LVAPAGSSTSRNAQARPSVTLLWPGPPGGDYALIVDGAASVRDGAIAVRPTRAVQHRLATADQALPNCVAIESATATGLTGAGG
jgi:hypothetical protein